MSVRSAIRGIAESVLVRLPRTTRPGARLILAYHNVVPNDCAPPGDVSLHMPLHKFESHLRMIRNEADIVPLMEILTEDAPNDRRVAVTFDDAYASAMDLGLGACAAVDAPSAVFVAPALLGTVPEWDVLAAKGQWSAAHRESFLWERHGRSDQHAAADVSVPAHELLRISTPDELARAASRHEQLLTVGNHTFTHPNLGSLSAAEVNTELTRCDEWLTQALSKHRVPVVAFPYGIEPPAEWFASNTSSNGLGLLAAGGWIDVDEATEPLRIARYNVPSGLSAHGFSIRLKGRLA